LEVVVKLRSRRVLLIGLVALPVTAVGCASIHAQTSTSYVTERTLPCVDVTVYVTHPPPYVSYCPPF
jgi:hypothetical protein